MHYLKLSEFQSNNQTGPIVGGVLGVIISIVLILVLILVVAPVMRCQRRHGKDIQGTKSQCIHTLLKSGRPLSYSSWLQRNVN